MVRQKQQNDSFILQKKPVEIWGFNVDNMVISKLVETKSNSKYLIGYLDEVIRALVLILPKMRGYVKIMVKNCVTYLFFTFLNIFSKCLITLGHIFKYL